MKLIQYRFLKNDAGAALDIARGIQDLFESTGDTNLVMLQVAEPSRDRLIVVPVNPHQLFGIIQNSFSQSFSKNIDYNTIATVKSCKSCRFVVFEDDGLVRICYSQGDEPLKFNSNYTEKADVSRLLIDTDLFDFA